MADSICWRCQKACGKCSWSKDFKPVDNWVAKKHNVSYTVIKCPCFEEDTRPRVSKITVHNVSQILKCRDNALYDLTDAQIINRCKKKGYDILIERNEKHQRRYYIYA